MSKEKEMLDLSVDNLLDELKPEELAPRLEMQVLVDPLAALSLLASDNNCRDGGNCNVENL